MSEEIKKTILELEDIQQIQPDFEQLKILNKETSQQIQVLIFAKEGNTLKIITTNNFNSGLKKILKILDDKGYKYKIYYTSLEGFNYAFNRYSEMEAGVKKVEDELKKQEQAEGIGAINMIKKLYDKKDSIEPGNFIMEVVRLSFQTGASDLHFQPEMGEVKMKIRIDGVLQDIEKFTIDDFQKYLQKIMFIAGTKLNIDYIPQDGRFSFDAIDLNGNSRSVDARVNFMPGMQIPSTVIRFLDSTMGIKKFDDLGFQGRNYDILKRNINKNTGVTIFTGPTGSGKTTTLYSILSYLNDGKRKIITLEDPVEYQIPGIQQSQINYSKGYTYELGLKAVLRHDPDVILIGEIRVQETADIGINAALTGHLVFSTLHTNSAIEGISRLLNMGVKPYMIAPAINLIVGQRLIRKICPHCNKKVMAGYGESDEILQSIKIINEINPKLNLQFNGEILKAIGCERCNNTGYQGRTTIVEAFEVTDDIKDMIIKGRSDIDLYAKARENGYLTLKEDGIIKMLAGKTTIDELRRVI